MAQDLANRWAANWPGLSRTLWLRQPDQAYRFVFCAESPQGLYVEPAAKAAGLDALRDDAAGRGWAAVTGSVTVADDNTLTFAPAGDAPGLLAALAAWMRERIGDVPALAAVLNATVARTAPEPAIWEGILEPTAATLAAALANAAVGDRFWYWMPADQGPSPVPLLMQPVAQDINRDRMDHLIRRTGVNGAAEAASGVCLAADTGVLQFTGSGLTLPAMAALAAWVRANVIRHPPLAALCDCAFLEVRDGRVASVIADADLWQFLPRRTLADTLAHARATLEALGADSACRFWMTAQADGGGFVGLVSAADDPDSAAFRQRSARYFRRFPGAYADALLGEVRRQPDGSLLFATQDKAVGAWPAVTQALSRQWGPASPLRGAALVQLAGANVLQVLPARQG